MGRGSSKRHGALKGGYRPSPRHKGANLLTRGARDAEQAAALADASGSEYSTAPSHFTLPPPKKYNPDGAAQLPVDSDEANSASGEAAQNKAQELDFNAHDDDGLDTLGAPAEFLEQVRWFAQPAADETTQSSPVRQPSPSRDFQPNQYTDVDAHLAQQLLENVFGVSSPVPGSPVMSPQSDNSFFMFSPHPGDERNDSQVVLDPSVPAFAPSMPADGQALHQSLGPDAIFSEPLQGFGLGRMPAPMFPPFGLEVAPPGSFQGVVNLGAMQFGVSQEQTMLYGVPYAQMPQGMRPTQVMPAGATSGLRVAPHTNGHRSSRQSERMKGRGRGGPRNARGGEAAAYGAYQAPAAVGPRYTSLHTRAGDVARGRGRATRKQLYERDFPVLGGAK